MKFNVIICAYNEFNNLRDLIPYLMKSNYRNTLNEVIVVSSGSNDGTDDLVLKYSEKFNKPSKFVLKLLTEPEKRGKYSAINLALENCRSKSDVLVFLSADVIPAKGSIDYLIEYFKDPKVGCVAGKPVPRNRDRSIISQLGIVAWRLHHAVMKKKYEMGTLRHAAGDMMAFRNGIIRRMPKLINDDEWMALETYRKGYKLIYEPKSIVYIQTPHTLKDFLNQRIRFNRGHYQMIERGLRPQVLSFMSIRERLQYIFEDIRTKKSLFIMMILMGLELYIKFKSRDVRSASENWQRIDSTKKGFRR